MKKIMSFAATVALCLAAASASASTIIDFGATTTPTSVKKFTADGITVSARGFRLTSSGPLNVGMVTQNTKGLGVSGSNDNNGDVDGSNLTDALVLSFSTTLKSIRTMFSNIDSDDAWDIYIDNGSGTFTQIGDEKNSLFYTYRGNIERIAYVADGADDDFRVRGVEISTVPLPAPALMLLSGLGGLVAMRRRKR